MTGQPHPAHDVDLEEPQPVVVGDLLERLGLEDAEVVDQDVNVGDLADEIGHALGSGQVGGDSSDLARHRRTFDLLDGFFDTLRRSTVDDDEAPSRYRPLPSPARSRRSNLSPVPACPRVASPSNRLLSW